MSDRTPKPPFTASFPRDPTLDAAVEAFGRGDYAFVRKAAARIEASGTEEVKRATRELVERTQPAKLAVALLVIAAGLLVVIGGYWMIAGRAPPPSHHAAPARPAATP